MTATFQIPLDIPDVEILSTQVNPNGDLIIEVKSTLSSTRCRRCSKEITRFHGYDKAIRLRHLPILEQKVFIRLQPKRYQCPHCSGGPTTTQRCEWYEVNSPHTKAFERWLLKCLINSTIQDVSVKLDLGKAAVEGVIDRWVSETVDWSRFRALETLGLDEIALRKGHDHFVTIVSHRDRRGEMAVLAVLPDRCKATVKAFLQSIPAPLKATVQRVCTDMYEGFTNAAREALPGVELIIDRFHVAKHYREGVDGLRKQTLRELKQTLSEEDYEPLKGLLWLFRRDWSQLAEAQRQQLLPLFERAPLLKQAYLLRNLLTFVFDAAPNKAKAQEYLNAWRQLVIDSGLTCFDAFLKTLDTWFDEITNYFQDRHSSGFVEGLNNKLKVIKRRCYGLFDTGHFFQRIQIDLEGERLLNNI
jgi:transposase